MNAYQEVERLSESVRAGNFVALDKILIKCRAYMGGQVPSVGQSLGLRPAGARMFDLLLARRGYIVSRESLFDITHREEADTLMKVVDVQISYVRKKLKGTEYEGKIRSVYGEGYVLGV